LNRYRRTIVLNQIIDVQLSEGIFQQQKGVGTITIITERLVIGEKGKLGNLSISLINIPEPRETYDLIRSLAIKPSAQGQTGTVIHDSDSHHPG
jgi:hypothetical protein